MKYKYGFVKKIKSKTGNQIWYRDEILEIMREYGMDTSKIEATQIHRWYPHEVFWVLEGTTTAKERRA